MDIKNNFWYTHIRSDASGLVPDFVPACPVLKGFASFFAYSSIIKSDKSDSHFIIVQFLSKDAFAGTGTTDNQDFLHKYLYFLVKCDLIAIFE